MIARRSRQVGAPAHWTSSPLTALRDTALPLLPNSLFARSATAAYGWTPRTPTFERPTRCSSPES